MANLFTNLREGDELNQYADFIWDYAMSKGVDPFLAMATAMHESGGMGMGATSSVGARGFFQLMPETAADLGVDINDPYDNIRGGIDYLAQQIQTFGSYDLALAAYNAGAGNAETAYNDVWGETAQHGSDIYGLFNSIGGTAEHWLGASRYSGFVDPFSVLDNRVKREGREPEIVDKPEHDPNDDSFIDKVSDSFLNAWFSNGTVSTARAMAYTSAPLEDNIKNNRGINGNWKPTREEFDNAYNVLEGDTEALEFIVSNARTSAQMQSLLEMKRIDKERAKRVEQRDYGVHSAGAVLGYLLDPLNLLSMGEAGVLNAIPKISRMSVLTKALGFGAKTAALNTADQYLAKEYGGQTDVNLELAAALGFVGGAGMMSAAHYLKNGIHFKPNGHAQKLKAQFTAQAQEGLSGVPNASKRYSKTGIQRGYKVDVDEAVGRKAKNRTYILDDDNTSVLVSTSVPKGRKGISKETLMTTFRGFANETVPRRITRTSDKKHVLPLSSWQKENHKATEEEAFSYFFKLEDKNPQYKVLKKTIAKEMGVSDLDDNVFRDMMKDAFIDETLRKYDWDFDETLEKIYMPNGLVISPENPVLNGFVDEFIKLIDENPAQLTSPIEKLPTGIARIPKLMSQWLNKNIATGDSFGRLSNSKLKSARVLSDMLNNSLHSGKFDVPSIEAVKQKVFSEMNVYVNDLEKAASRYALEQLKAGQVGSIKMYKKEFGRLVFEAYEKEGLYDIATHEVREGVDILKQLREYERDLRRRYHIGDVFEDSKDNKLWRYVDVVKRSDYLNKFETKEQAIDFLKKYIRKNMTPEDIEAEAKRWAKETNNPFDQDTYFDNKKFQKWLKKEVSDAAFGFLDRGESSKFSTSATYSLDNLPKSMRHRFRYDSSMIEKLPNGEPFSVDKNLRSMDALSAVLRVQHSLSSEVAFAHHGIDNPAEMFKDLLKKAEYEMVQINQKTKGSSRSEMARDLEAMYTVANQLAGVPIPSDFLTLTRTPIDRVFNILRNMSYSKNGMKMGLSAIGEGFNFATATKPELFLTRFCPKAMRTVMDMRKSVPFTGEQFEVAMTHLRCLELAESLTHDMARVSKMNNPQQTSSLLYSMLDLGETLSESMARATSKSSLIQKITNQDIAATYASVMADSYAWAKGDLDNFFRKALFSQHHLDNAGIPEKAVPEFKNFIRQLFNGIKDNTGAHGLYSRLRQFDKIDPINSARFEAFLRNASRRNIMQPGIGTENYFWKQNNFMRMIYQFRDFTRMSINGHLARVMQHGDRNDIAGFLGSGGMGMGIYAFRVWLTANTFYANDPEKREEYLERELSPTKLAWAFLSRGSYTAAFGLMEDAVQIAFDTGSSSTRTTATNRGGSFISRLIDRSPIMSTVADAGESTLGVASDLLNYGEVSKERKQAVNRMMSFQGLPYIQFALALMYDEDEPRKRSQDKTLKQLEKEHNR